MKVVSVILLMVMTFLSGWSYGQKKSDDGRNHKIVFQFTNGQNSTQQKAFIKQLDNLSQHWPKARFHVVVYNKGLDLLLPEKSVGLTQLEELANRGITFVVCENSMKPRKLTKDHFPGFVGFVPAGIAEVIKKQEEGYSYIKGGY